MPRTKEEFDHWFRQSGGDPWKYGGSFVQDRLDRSLEFVKRHVPNTFLGAFIEIGAFNGDFTKRLAFEFDKSRILANDISEVALEQAREKTAGIANVAFNLSDLASFRLPSVYAGDQTVLLVMEALYYLPHEERAQAVRHLLHELHAPLTFISGPIQGDAYFQERELMKLFGSLGFKCVDIEALNWTDAFHKKIETASSFWRKVMLWRLQHHAAYRQKYARQVMYCFKSRV